MTENEARLALHNDFQSWKGLWVYSEGDFNLGFAEPQQSEQALRGRGRGWSELPYYFYLGCPSWHHPEWFTIFLFYLYFTIYLFHIWLLPYEYQTALWSDLNVKSRSKKLLSLKKKMSFKAIQIYTWPLKKKPNRRSIFLMCTKISLKSITPNPCHSQYLPQRWQLLPEILLSILLSKPDQNLSTTSSLSGSPSNPPTLL